MFFDKRPAGAGFEVFFEFEGDVFFGEGNVRNQLNWQSWFCGWHISAIMAFDSLVNIFRTANIQIAINAF